MGGPSITDWISAVSTAALGILGAFVTIWQWHRSSFRPKIRPRIDNRRQAVEVQIINTGRAGGIVNQVDIVVPGQARNEFDVVDGVAFKGFTDEKFRPVALPALASMLIVIRAPADQPFATSVRVLVDVGAARPKKVSPVSTNLGLAGLASILPPGTSS
jgi:hypothetical protein